MCGSCPGCHRENDCNCDSCVKRRGSISATGSIWEANGECLRCWFCGETFHADEWLDSDDETYYLGVTLGVYRLPLES